MFGNRKQQKIKKGSKKMLKVITNFTTEYRFADKAEKKIKNYAKKQGLTYVDAIYDLFGMEELDLELNSCYKSEYDPKIIEAEEI